MKRTATRGLTVVRKRCDQCLFSTARIVSAERKAEVLRSCERTGRFFVCHKSERNAGCRGFYDEMPTQAQQVLGRLGMLEFVDVPEAT